MGHIIRKALFLLLAGGLLLFAACDNLRVEDSLAGLEYNLLDQYNDEVSFPEQYAGNVVIVSYVYTYCPDICPMITYNMRDIQRALPDAENFMLVSVSFDPLRDTPETLYEYANNYRLDQSNWRLLTGDPDTVENLLDKLRIRTLKSPTRFTEDGGQIYFIDHTDRITLLDHEGNVRRNYSGSDVDPDMVVKDIKRLLSEI